MSLQTLIHNNCAHRVLPTTAVSQPLVTVTIAGFNKEAYIALAIQSVLDQTYPAVELIVVDDGSSDQTFAVMESFRDDPRVTLVHQENQGVASVRNRGIRDGRGDYIVFLDGDDYLYPDYLETGVRNMELHPHIDCLHVGFDLVDEDGGLLEHKPATHLNDYLATLLKANHFAIHAVFCRMSFVRKAGYFNDYTVTDDWEYWIRCARDGARFHPYHRIKAATRRHPKNNQREKAKQKLKCFPIIKEVFAPAYGLSETYRKLRDTSRIRHHYFLMEEYQRWGWHGAYWARFGRLWMAVAKNKWTAHVIRLADMKIILKNCSVGQRMILALTCVLNIKTWGHIPVYMLPSLMVKGPQWKSRILSKVQNGHAKVKRRCGQLWRRFHAWTQRPPRWGYFLAMHDPHPYDLKMPFGVIDLRTRTLAYVNHMRMSHRGRFIGYRHSESCTRPTLYSAIMALLIKHLYHVSPDERTQEELDLLCSFQDKDGLFRDPVIDSPYATYKYEGWGWSHLTLMAAMTLALYRRGAHTEMLLDGIYQDEDTFRHYMGTRAWWGRDYSYGNQLQNVGVRLQYIRDYQCGERAARLLDIWYELAEKHQSPETGLYGDAFHTPYERSEAVMAGFHLWLIYFYDRKIPPHHERIMDSVLKTQNVLGGFGVRWNSSACEDIDSIDPLVRLSQYTDYRKDDVTRALDKGLSAVLHNLNADGGWVFRRHVPNFIQHRQMSSAIDMSNMWYSWYRTLSIAYALEGLGDNCPEAWRYHWNWQWAPGHQFFDKRQ